MMIDCLKLNCEEVIEKGELAAIRAHHNIESMPIPTLRKKRLRVIEDNLEPIKSD